MSKRHFPLISTVLERGEERRVRAESFREESERVRDTQRDREGERKSTSS